MTDRRWIAPLSLVALVAGVYALKLGDPFQWDDFHFIIRDRFVQDPANLWAFFSADSEGLYRPLRSVVYLLLWLVPGRSPVPYHLAGIAFHIATTLAVFGIVRRLYRRRDVGWWAAALFGVHPLATGRVANITGSLDIPGVMLALVSFWLLLVALAGDRKRAGLRAASVATYVAALFYGEEAVVIAPLIFVYGLTIGDGAGGRGWRRAIVLAGPYLAAVVVYAAVRTVVLRQVGRVDLGTSEHLAAVMATPLIFIRYLLRLAFPVFQSPAYGVTPEAVGHQAAALALPILLLLVVATYVLLRRQKEIGFCCVWLLAALLPFSNIVPTGELMADRYCYHAAAAFWAAAVGAVGLTVGLRRPAVRVLLGAVLLLFAALTVHRVHLWADPLTLWADAVENTPRSVSARINYGLALRDRGMNDEALAQFDQAARIDPSSASAQVNRAQIHFEAGRIDEAARAFARALSAEPDNPGALAGMANLLIVSGDLDAARRLAERAEALDPTRDSVHNALAFIAYRQGRIDEAVRRYEFVAATSLDVRLVDGANRALEAIRSQQDPNR